MKQKIVIFCMMLGLVAGASMLAAASAANQASRPANRWVGTYKATVAGWYSGEGNVGVNPAGKLHIRLTVKGSDGRRFNFNVPNIDTATGFFEKVTANGLTISDGRFDAPAPGEPYAIRFSCSYQDDSGHAGRIVGIKLD